MREDNGKDQERLTVKEKNRMQLLRKKERGERRMNRIKKMLLHDGGFYKAVTHNVACTYLVSQPHHHVYALNNFYKPIKTQKSFSAVCTVWECCTA